MNRNTINLILYSTMGILFISICVLTVLIINRPRYVTVSEPAKEIKEISFNVNANTVSQTPEALTGTESESNSVVKDASANSPKRGKTSTKVNIREAADAEARLLETVEEGYTFDILEILDSGWVKITYNGQDAFISAKYVILIN